MLITLDPRLPFYTDSVGGIFPGPATTQKVYQGIEWFSQLAGPQWLTVLNMLIRGITITLTGDWHSGWLAALSHSIMLRNSLLTEQKVYQGIEWFSQLAGPQWLTVLNMLIRGITITLTGDWHSGWLAALSHSIMLRNSLLTEGKIRHISVPWMWWLTKMMFQLLIKTQL